MFTREFHSSDFLYFQFFLLFFFCIFYSSFVIVPILFYSKSTSVFHYLHKLLNQGFIVVCKRCMKMLKCCNIYIFSKFTQFSENVNWIMYLCTSLPKLPTISIYWYLILNRDAKDENQQLVLNWVNIYKVKMTSGGGGVTISQNRFFWKHLLYS